MAHDRSPFPDSRAARRSALQRRDPPAAAERRLLSPAQQQQRRGGPLRALARLLAALPLAPDRRGAALVFTAGATLTLGKGLQVLIDRGFGSGNPNALGEAVSLVMVITTAIAVGTFLRFYLVSWLGERVSADLRSAVFRNLVRLHPGFFEDNRSGEIMSRLTAIPPYCRPSSARR
jgi:ATP-binding cassette subfamily B protein